MSDSFTTQSTRSWGSRLGGSFKGILIGVILFLISFPLLWWNEGRTVERHQALQEGAGAVISVDSNSLDLNHEGRLIHISGNVHTAESLTDAEFGINANQALRLRRTVEMFQWQERSEGKTEKNVGGSETQTTTYRYDKTWSSTPIDSSRFKQLEGHHNPEQMAYPAKTLTAQQARLGAYRIAPEQIAEFAHYQPIWLEGLQFSQLPTSYRNLGDHLFIGIDPDNPRVGDLRIRFSQMPATEASLVGAQQQDRLTPYRTESGGSILLIQVGLHSAASLFESAQQSNTVIAWLIRFGGFLLMFIGIRLMLKPLSVIADVIPLLGSLVAFGTGTLALILALPLTLLTIALAWIAYRPLLAAVLIGAGLLLFGLPVWNRSRAGAASSAPPPPPPK